MLGSRLRAASKPQHAGQTPKALGDRNRAQMSALLVPESTTSEKSDGDSDRPPHPEDPPGASSVRELVDEIHAEVRRSAPLDQPTPLLQPASGSDPEPIALAQVLHHHISLSRTDQVESEGHVRAERIQHR